MFWTFLLQTEQDMASCSRTFRKPKSAEEERNLIENVISQHLQWQNGQWKFFWNGRMLQKTKIQQSSWNIKYAPSIFCVIWVLIIN